MRKFFVQLSAFVNISLVCLSLVSCNPIDEPGGGGNNGGGNNSSNNGDNGSGDKKLVYRTDVINQYPPYPVFEGERYVALAYKYRLIDQDYKLAVINEVLCNVEYQVDGHSTGMWKEYVRSPKGFALWRKVCMRYPESKKRLIVDCIHYCSSSIIAKNKAYIKESPRKLLTLLCTVPGWLLSCYTRYRIK